MSAERIRVAAVSANFGRDMETCFAQIASFISAADRDGCDLVVFPEATLGGYLADLSGADGLDLPPALDIDGPELRRVSGLAGRMVVCLGYCEAVDGGRYNAAACVSGDGVLGHHRKVHQPLEEGATYLAGSTFEAFDTPVGRMGLNICYDKAFPEAARTLALQGAEIISCMSAWPSSRTAVAASIDDDRWTKRFDLYDQARALENQVLWVSANQSGRFGTLSFVGRAKVCGPGGEVLAATGTGGGVAMVDVELRRELALARRSMFHLRDRRPDSYRITSTIGAPR